MVIEIYNIKKMYYSIDNFFFALEKIKKYIKISVRSI